MADELLNELVEFARENHDGYRGLSVECLRAMFLTYQDFTIINRVDGKIAGVGLYQEWPDCLNFICMIGNPEHDKIRNVKAMMKGHELLPKKKKIVFFDEKAMELKTLCQPQPQDGSH